MICHICKKKLLAEGMSTANPMDYDFRPLHFDCWFFKDKGDKEKLENEKGDKEV